MWIAQFSGLYQLRTEHLSNKGDLTPVAPATNDDYRAAAVLFGQGVNGCLSVLRHAV